MDGTVVAVFNNIAPSLSLTAPLEVGSGGTGVSSLNNHYVLVGSDADAITPVTPSTSGGTGVTSLTDPTFQAAVGVHSLGMAMVIGG